VPTGTGTGTGTNAGTGTGTGHDTGAAVAAAGMLVHQLDRKLHTLSRARWRDQRQQQPCLLRREGAVGSQSQQHGH
jgi:hypothetical protein